MSESDAAERVECSGKRVLPLAASNVLTRVARSPHLVAFLRGSPGLGRTVQGLALTQLIAGRNPLQQQSFYSDGVGLRFLASLGLSSFELPEWSPTNNADSIINHPAIHDAVIALSESSSVVAVVDGQPFLLPILRKLLRGSVISLVNEYDLTNPAHSPGQSTLFQALYTNADLTVVPDLVDGVSYDTIMGTPVLRLPAPSDRTSLRLT